MVINKNEIKLPPLPEKSYLGDDASYGYESWDMEEYARAAIKADRNEREGCDSHTTRQSRDCGQCVPFSTDGKSVFIDGVGEVPLDFGGQARGNAVASVVSSGPVSPEGFRLIAVNEKFDSLMFWLDRCEQKGHLENCPDLVGPWEEFEYREFVTEL